MRTWWCGVILSGQVRDVRTNRSTDTCSNSPHCSTNHGPNCSSVCITHGIANSIPFCFTERFPDRDPNLRTDCGAVCAPHALSDCHPNAIANSSSVCVTNRCAVCNTFSVAYSCPYSIANCCPHGDTNNVTDRSADRGTDNITHNVAVRVAHRRTNCVTYVFTHGRAYCDAHNVANSSTVCHTHHGPYVWLSWG